ncbi:hypothetical protein LDENG_00253290 [Lucifuga dentata]|nr:hypothetical protein LDENG_00253290 [Lucifuga dentata]
MQQMVNSDSHFTSSQQPIEAALGPRSQSGLSQLSTINQSQLGLNGNSVAHNSPSPPGSKSTTPSPSSSAHEDENDDTLRQASGGEKRPAAVDISKKPKTPKKKKRKDPNEPVKPVSAYALFFRDTQASIKAQNPNATFGEVSKIVASMWDCLGEEQKQEYKQRTETAKKEYLKQLAAYRASLVSQIHPKLQALAYRGTVPQASVTHQGALSLGSVEAASPPPLQISPPLHSQAHLGGLQSPHQQHGGHTVGMTHSSAVTQEYPPSLQSDYQPIGGAMLNSGAVMSSSVDYHQLGRHTPNHHPSLNWSADYHGNGGLQRDKPLFLS